MFCAHVPTRSDNIEVLIQSLVDLESSPHPHHVGVLHLHGYFSKRDVWDNLLQLGLNPSHLVEYSTFNKIWKKRFPHLLTESDRPGCQECITLHQDIHNSQFGEKQKLEQRLEKHMHHAKGLTEASLNAALHAKSRTANVSSICIDNMSQKSLPKAARASPTIQHLQPLTVSFSHQI